MVWQKIRSSGLTGNILCVSAQEKPARGLWAGTKAAVYSIAESGEGRAVLQLGGQNFGTQKIVVDTGEQEAQTIYAVADNALYRSKDSGKHWEKIFSSNEENMVCRTVAVNHVFIYLGTSKGILTSPKTGIAWQKLAGPLAEKDVFRIELAGQSIYAVTLNEVWEIPGTPWEDTLSKASSQGVPIFTLVGHEKEYEDSVTLNGTSGAARRIKDFKVLIDPVAKVSGFFVATDNGVYASCDQGHGWQRMAVEGLPFKEITTLAIVPAKATAGARKISTSSSEADSHGSHGVNDNKRVGAGRVDSACPWLTGYRLLVGTQKGVFEYGDGYWRPLYKGMETLYVADLAVSDSGAVYAASGDGILRLAADDISVTSGHVPAASRMSQERNNILTELAAEGAPSVQQVQAWAVDYAEVDNEKIRSWRQAARKKAIMPSVSAGVSRGDGELFHWDTTPNPDQLIRGRDYTDWSVSLSWDLGELIWNPDQTSIDSRSKMMVELREDLLAQVTRLYFERRRLRTELLSDSQIAAPEYLDREMRIEELTALIDGFTGGRFSRALAVR